ncbi:ABC transporter substrate-binding protein [Paenibacillus sp. MSJ-34]|uniref:ABC transporter substrate-binding protein n=1 Tax=Paenibacillus sp. MSJ-34 TaxID=2841529 RepID=UPI001C0F3F0F|nr:ABC transporter substrate-binding protein [Paenibacillus sp. MSJ-34]MBU5444724.1 ABC transporter substrate-binding protein [Paenibacillus sp. MSJ-34]
MKTGKHAYAIILIAALLLIMTACSSSQNPSMSSEPSSQSETANGSGSSAPSAQPEAATKTIKDGLDREVEIPTRPEKMVVLGNMGEVLSLGIKPIGTNDYYLNKFEPERMAGIASVGGDEPSMEKILDLEPDLIIIPSYFKPEIVEALHKIAPTIATKWGLLPREHLSVLAEWLGREAEEQTWLAQYADKAAQTKEALKPFHLEGEKAIVLQFWNKSIYQHATTVFTPLFEDIGFIPTDAQSKVTESKGISEEAVVDYAADADRLFILVDGQNDIDMYHQLKETAWKNIPAVQNDKVMLVESARWNDYSTAAMEWMLEDLVQLIK